MNDQEHGALFYIPLGLLAILIILVGLLALSPARGGPFQVLRTALREWAVGNERLVVDPATPVYAASREVPSVPLPTGVPTIPLGIPLTPVPVLTSTLPCAAFRFAGTVQIEEGRVSFGRLNLVTDTDPAGERDALALWKLVQFEAFALDLGALEAARTAAEGAWIAVPVSQTVAMSISDPFSGDSLLSAQWRIGQLDLRDSRASVNAALQANLSGLRVRNSIGSATLATLSKETTGVLVMSIEGTQDVAAAILARQPVYARMYGVVHPAHCLR